MYTIVKQKSLADLKSKTIQLEAENDKLKDEMIETLKKENLQLQLMLDVLLKPPTYIDDERDVGSHMIAPSDTIISRPRIRTMSEVSMFLEQRARGIAKKQEGKDE